MARSSTEADQSNTGTQNGSQPLRILGGVVLEQVSHRRDRGERARSTAQQDAVSVVLGVNTHWTHVELLLPGNTALF